MSQHGILSRRDSALAVRRGRVTVDGVVVTDPGHRVGPGAEIRLDGERLVPPPRLAALHKERGVHSTVHDDHGRRSLGTEAAALLALGLHPVGRLDADTSGLLLFSLEGALTQGLLHPRRAIERVYEAETDPPPVPELVTTLASGVRTAEGTFTARVRAIEGAKITLSVTEGRHRMVRRMLANAGHPVLALHRIAYGPVQLGELAPGAWRPLTEPEIEAVAASIAPGGPK